MPAAPVSTRASGPSSLSIREARHGDRYMLCSDGLSDVVTNDTIQEAMLLDEPQDAADRLVELALRGGGPDNVTVIVAEVAPAGGTDDPETSAAAAVGPMLVGAAAAQPRRGGMFGRVLSRQRHGDTGELDPVSEPPPDPEFFAADQRRLFE